MSVELTQKQINTIDYALQCVLTEINDNYTDTQEALNKLDARVEDVYSAFGNLI
jgi:hypothetical protein